MTLCYDVETDTFYCYCIDDGHDAVALVPSDGIYKCSNCGRFLTELEASMERDLPKEKEMEGLSEKRKES